MTLFYIFNRLVLSWAMIPEHPWRAWTAGTLVGRRTTLALLLVHDLDRYFDCLTSVKGIQVVHNHIQCVLTVPLQVDVLLLTESGCFQVNPWWSLLFVELQIGIPFVDSIVEGGSGDNVGSLGGVGGLNHDGDIGGGIEGWDVGSQGDVVLVKRLRIDAEVPEFRRSGGRRKERQVRIQIGLGVSFL